MIDVNICNTRVWYSFVEFVVDYLEYQIILGIGTRIYLNERLNELKSVINAKNSDLEKLT